MAAACIEVGRDGTGGLVPPASKEGGGGSTDDVVLPSMWMVRVGTSGMYCTAWCEEDRAGYLLRNEIDPDQALCTVHIYLPSESPFFSPFSTIQPSSMHPASPLLPSGSPYILPFLTHPYSPRPSSITPTSAEWPAAVKV